MGTLSILPFSALAAGTGGWTTELGSGSYGVVFAGTLAGAPVAVKRFRSREAGPTDSFLRELAVTALVRHPAVLRVLAMARALPTASRLGGRAGDGRAWWWWRG